MGLDGSKFTIEEVLSSASRTRGETPAKFEWDAEHHNMPQGRWEYAIKLRTKRTDYPGGDSPTEQVLGPNYEPFEMRGTWLDKWNEPGYASDTRRGFEALARRGNLCSFTWRDITFVGLITDLKIQIKTSFDIGYSFTVSPHNRGGQEDDLSFKASPPMGKDLSAVARFLEQNAAEALLLVQAPRARLQSPIDSSDLPVLPLEAMGTALQAECITLAKDISGAAVSVSAAVDKALLSPITDTLAALKTLVSALAIVRGRCQVLTDRLAEVRANEQGLRSSLSFYQFEEWRRGMTLHANLMWNVAYEAEEDTQRRAQPDILALHLARANESLYTVSLKYYGTPTAWKTIAQRNGLQGFILQGGELLVIPMGAHR